MKEKQMNDLKEKLNLKVEEGNNSIKTIVIIYGFSEHISKYDEFSSMLINQGYRIVRYDLRGHGNALGIKGDIECYYDMIDDLNDVITYVKDTYVEEEIYTIGYSMGGLISLLYGVMYGAKEDIKGQILIAPETDVPLKGFKPKMLNLLSYIVPKCRIYNPMYNSKGNSEDNQLLKEMTLRFSREMFIVAPKYLKMNFDKYVLPCLFIHGDADKWIKIDNSRYAINNMLSNDKELVELKGKGHGLLNPKEIQDSFVIITDWLKKK